MIGTRPTDNEETNQPALNLSAHDAPVSPQPCSTASIQNALQKALSTSDEKPHAMFESFLVLEPEPAPYYPPSILNTSTLLQTQQSDAKKNELGVKPSSHSMNIVICLDQACDIVFSPLYPHDLNLNLLPGKGTACYLFTPDKKLYYADKLRKRCAPVPISPQNFDILCQNIQIQLPENPINENFECLAGNIDKERLQAITNTTKHMHNMVFYKENSIDSVMSVLEAANSTAYQLLGPFHFPTCKAVRNPEHRDIGVASKELPGFKPNRDKPLLPQDLEISSLKNMIKSRDDTKALDYVFNLVSKLIPLMKREVREAPSVLSGLWQFGAQNYNYYLGDTYCAVHVKPKLEGFLKENIHSITFGKLDDLRELLVNRKSNIQKTAQSYVASLHKHDDELLILNQAIDQLSMILLDEIALFMKHLDRISRELQNLWVDIEAELANPNSKYGVIQIEAGLSTKLDVKLIDVLHYRNSCGLAIGLTSRYFMMDPDGHAKNLASDGKNVDGDLAVFPLIYRFKNPSKKPGHDDFILDLNDFFEFPKLKVARFRYWPTVVTLADTSVDTALSGICDVTKNYFNVQDSNNFQSLENSPIFNFQKYVQLIVYSLTNKDMYTACAKLHMTDQIPMLNNEGDTTAPLPLFNELGQPQDVRTIWVECLSNRAAEARSLAKKLLPIKNMLLRHNDFVLKLVQNHFRDFLRNQAMELSFDAFCMLEETMNPAVIENLFYQFSKEMTMSPLVHVSSELTPSDCEGTLSGTPSKVTAPKQNTNFLDRWDGAMLASRKKVWETMQKEETENDEAVVKKRTSATM